MKRIRIDRAAGAAGCLFLIWGILACGPVGGMNMDEEGNTTDTAAAALSLTQNSGTTSLSGPECFAYTIVPMNSTETFPAYNDTRFDIVHTGECPFTFELIHLQTGDVWEELVSGVGSLNARILLHLPWAEYRIRAVTDCPWQIDIACVPPDDSGGSASEAGYIGCEDGCCSTRGETAGCDCDTGRCICGDGSIRSTCSCSCLDDPGGTSL